MCYLLLINQIQIYLCIKCYQNDDLESGSRKFVVQMHNNESMMNA